MIVVDPRTTFPDFYQNPAIATLASACRWTISGRIGELESKDGSTPTNKAPIDVRHLIDERRVRGAWEISPTCLVTLEELTREIPGAANTAFYLQAHNDGLMVIDIESGCPDQIAMELLQLPGILYSELSMSGRGYHLVTALPENFDDFPVAAGKRVLRQEDGHYEILLDHFATFTRTPIPDHVLARSAATPPGRFASIEDLYAELAEKAVDSLNVSPTAVATDEQMPDIPFAEDIIARTLVSCDGHLRDPSRFNHDMSRWEFSVLGSLYGWLRTQITMFSAMGVEYDSGDHAWLLYGAARKVIPYRQKHSQTRNGRPYLLDRAAALVAQREAAQERARAEAEA